MVDGPVRRIHIERVDTPKSREMARRAEARRTQLVPIYFQHTSDLSSAEAQSALLGVMDAMKAAGQQRKLVNLGSQSFGDGPFSNPDWYAQEAYRTQTLRRTTEFGPQVDVENVANLLLNEPHQETPHWEVFVTATDFNTKGTDGNYINFVFGVTYPEFASVQSIKRYIETVPPGDLRNAMIRRLLRHEVGHLFGLPNAERGKAIEENLGAHCTNPCTMRQGLSIQEWAQLTIEEHNNDIHFCDDCQTDLAQTKSQYKPLA